MGTTNVKALLVDSSGQVLARGASPVATRHLADGTAEQDMDDIFGAVLKAVGQLRAQGDLRSVQAVGVSSQGGSLQLLDERDVPIGPSISWMDTRGRAYNIKLTQELGREWFFRHVGYGSSGVAIGQLLRLREQSPQEWGRAASIGFAGDVVVQRLCGRRAHHSTSLSIALLYNPYLRRADPQLLTMLGVRESQLPEILPATQAAGGLLAEISSATSLAAGIPVSAAVHDQYAAALGSGACQTGDVNFGSGTAWVLLATTDHLDCLPDADAFACDHAIDGKYGQLFSLGNVGAVFECAVHATNMAGRSPQEIDSAMLTAAAGCGGLRCWPHVSWPGSTLSEKARERLAELGRTLEPGQILRAVVEGLAMELTRQLMALRDSGCAIGRLVMAGKASASRATTQIIADVTGLPVAIAGEGETSALGAAVLGHGLIDPDRGLDQLSAQMTRIRTLIQPGPDRPAYQQMFAEYIKIMPRQRAWPTP